jgi:serine/threonine protein kinase
MTGMHRITTDGFTVQIVLEFCDCGSLRDVLDAGGFSLPGTDCINYLAVLDTAADVARGMVYLHKMDIVHSDLKVCHGGQFGISVWVNSAVQDLLKEESAQL